MPPAADPQPRPIERVLVLGARGMLGRAWRELLGARSIPFVGLDLPELDLRDEAGVKAAVREAGCSHAVNAAGWTDVDGAEANEAAAAGVNSEGVGVLSAACAAAGAHLLHYSTDYVFDGRRETPYPTDAPVCPLNAYGRTKAAGERGVAEGPAPWTIVRTSWLYAPWGRNFVRTMVDLMRQRDEVRVVADQHGRPTSAAHLAASSLALLERGVTGIWHVCDAGVCTWHDLAVAVGEHLGGGCRVLPCTTAEFPRPAPRPPRAVLDLTATEALLGPMPHWRANLGGVLADITGPGEGSGA